MNKLPLPPAKLSNGGSIVSSTDSSLCLSRGAIPSKVVGVETEIIANSAEVKAGGGAVKLIKVKAIRVSQFQVGVSSELGLTRHG